MSDDWNDKSFRDRVREGRKRNTQHLWPTSEDENTSLIRPTRARRREHRREHRRGHRREHRRPQTQANPPPYAPGPPPPYSFDDAFLIPASGTGAPPVIEVVDPPRHWAEKNFFLIVYCLASLINALGLISLPWLPGTSAYIVQSKFPNTVTGTLNGLSIINLSNIRLGIWTACYADYFHSETCLSWNANLAYHVIMTEVNNSHTIVQPIWTGLLKVQGFAAVFTVIAFACGWRTYCLWYAGWAALFTSLVLVADYIVLESTRNIAGTYGTGVSTNLGPGFWWIAFALSLIVVGSGHQWLEGNWADEAKKAADKAKKEAAFKELKENNIWTIQGAMVDQWF